jgi:acyl carrier protein
METIISQIQAGIQDVFPEAGDTTIHAAMTLGEIPDWDSMAAINLQAFLEQQFTISVPPDLLSEETTIAELVEMIQTPEKIDMAV